MILKFCGPTYFQGESNVLAFRRNRMMLVSRAIFPIPSNANISDNLVLLLTSIQVQIVSLGGKVENSAFYTWSQEHGG